MKAYRSKELPHYIVGNVVILLVLLNPSRSKDYIKEIGIAAALSATLYVYTFILDALLSKQVKIVLTYGSEYRLPGYKVFDDILKNRDIRYDAAVAKEQYANVYEVMDALTGKERAKYENTIWYTIYKKLSGDKAVEATQSDYLLCRDLNICTLSICVIYLLVVVLFWLVMGVILFNAWFLLILGIEWIVTNISMRNKAIRFVHTVIAKDLEGGEKK